MPPIYILGILLCIDKPESKSQVQAQSQIEKGKEEFGLWAVSKISWATHGLSVL